jgi:hypothetical protein
MIGGIVAERMRASLGQTVTSEARIATDMARSRNGHTKLGPCCLGKTDRVRMSPSPPFRTPRAGCGSERGDPASQLGRPASAS